MQIRAMLSRMDVRLTLLLSLVLLFASKGYLWGIGWIDFFERLDSFRERRASHRPALASGENRKRIDVRRTHDAEMAVVERGDLGLAKHLGGGDDGRIDKTQR